MEPSVIEVHVRLALHWVCGKYSLIKLVVLPGMVRITVKERPTSLIGGHVAVDFDGIVFLRGDPVNSISWFSMYII